MFSCEICELFKSTFFCRTPPVATSEKTLLRKVTRTIFTWKNTVISPNYLVWKFRGKAQFPQTFGRFVRNCRNCVFPKSFLTRKLGEITVFSAVFRMTRSSKTPLLCCFYLFSIEHSHKPGLFFLLMIYLGKDIEKHPRLEIGSSESFCFSKKIQ